MLCTKPDLHFIFWLISSDLRFRPAECRFHPNFHISSTSRKHSDSFVTLRHFSWPGLLMQTQVLRYSWLKWLDLRLQSLGSRVYVSVTPCRFRGGRNGDLGRYFSGFLLFSPTKNFIPPFLHTHLIRFVSFRFISSAPLMMRWPGSSSGKALGYGRDGLDPGCRRSGDVSSLLRVHTGPGVHSTFYKMNTGGSPRG